MKLSAYPDDPAVFAALAEKGAALRGLHLMESGALDDLLTTYPEGGSNEVVKPRFEKTVISSESEKSHADEPEIPRRATRSVGMTEGGAGKVWINESQYFGGVPELAWEFYIGGYQPAQKWLKDRKGRTLEVDDIMHYQRIIVALTETDRIMKEIDQIDFLPQGEDK